MRKLVYFITLIMLLVLVACSSSDPIIDDDNNGPDIIEDNLSGAWVVKASVGGSEIYGPFTIKTQVTTDKDFLSIKDEGGFWNFQLKASANMKGNSFESAATANEISKVGAKIKVLNGTVINKNSISFDIQFEDDEAPYSITYTIKGQKN